MMPAAIDMLPSPAEREDMREGGWLKLEADVRGVQLLRLSDSRHVFTPTLKHALGPVLCNPS